MLDVLRDLSIIEENLTSSNVFTFSDEDRTQCGLVLLSNKAESIIIDNKDISDVFHTHTSLLEYYYGDQSNIKWIEEAFDDGEDPLDLLQENGIYYRFNRGSSRFGDMSEDNDLNSDFEKELLLNMMKEILKRNNI